MDLNRNEIHTLGSWNPHPKSSRSNINDPPGIFFDSSTFWTQLVIDVMKREFIEGVPSITLEIFSSLLWKMAQF